MKKVFGVLAIALMAGGMTSCKKDFTCTCTTSVTGTTPITTSTTINATKADAEEACESGNAVANVSCSLD
ncbi:MAG: hypothetical protein ACJATE_001767 [Bacteroidia bacterium]|jgi:hypothetical protein